ncbi:MAG TPA: hypothetical protein VM166_08150 [Gemmatimonadaceae bacterium]|nr:hypothetical protein [Gemmatimonadaceae bacterium]
MFGCFRRLGCLVLFLILGVFAWFNRGRLEQIYRKYAGDRISTSAPATIPGGWEALTPEKAARGKTQVEALSRKTGPVFANLTAGEAASYIFLEVAKQLPASSQNILASVKDDRLVVRANVDVKDFGASALGPLAAMLGSRDTVELSGTMRVIRPGVGEFAVKSARIGSFPIPSALLPKLIQRMRKGTIPEGTSSDALPVKLPSYIGDIRIANGRIVVYKNLP